jgi:hypothetical protein
MCHQINFANAEILTMVDKKERAILPVYGSFYIQGMLFNAESAVRSILNAEDTLTAAAEKRPEDPTSVLSVHFLLNELQNIIVQAAALSRYFWPVRKNHEWRGSHLRKAFRMSESSPLRSRALRDAIEHFDERLDRYLENGIVGYVFPQYVGMFRDDEEVPYHCFRAFYIDTGIFELLGNRYELTPLAAEVVRVYEELRQMDGSGRLPEGTA